MHFDAVVANNTFLFRANATNLLSSEYLALVKQRLEPGGVYFYNTTGRDAHRRPLVRHFPLGLDSSIRIVFSLAFCQRLVSATTKSRWEIYAQVQRLSFHTAWVRSGLEANDRRAKRPFGGIRREGTRGECQLPYPGLADGQVLRTTKARACVGRRERSGR